MFRMPPCQPVLDGRPAVAGLDLEVVSAAGEIGPGADLEAAPAPMRRSAEALAVGCVEIDTRITEFAGTADIQDANLRREEVEQHGEIAGGQGVLAVDSGLEFGGREEFVEADGGEVIDDSRTPDRGCHRCAPASAWIAAGAAAGAGVACRPSS